MKGRRIVGAALAALWLLSAPVGDAHARDYLVSQHYRTAKRGEIEVAFHNDLNLSDAGDEESYGSKHQIEVEYGLLDHLQLAYYEVYTWADGRDDAWERDEFKIEAKLRMAEAGQWPVDVALYAEYKNPNGSRDARSDALENKVILSKNFGPWNLVGNFIFEREIDTHDAWAFEYTAGVSYRLTPKTRVGIEIKESLGDEDEPGVRRADHELYVVPGIYTKLNPHVKVLAGPAIGLTRASDDVQLRTIVEVEF